VATGTAGTTVIAEGLKTFDRNGIAGLKGLFTLNPQLAMALEDVEVITVLWGVRQAERPAHGSDQVDHPFSLGRQGGIAVGHYGLSSEEKANKQHVQNGCQFQSGSPAHGRK
jgi:hypothetical protein